VALADAGRADEQDVAPFSDEPGGGQVTETVAWELGVKAPVEVGELLDLDDAGLLEPTREEAVGAHGELVGDEEFEELQVREIAALRLGEAGG
jgi:hypothetical protein